MKEFFSLSVRLMKENFKRMKEGKKFMMRGLKVSKRKGGFKMSLKERKQEAVIFLNKFSLKETSLYFNKNCQF